MGMVRLVNFASSEGLFVAHPDFLAHLSLPTGPAEAHQESAADSIRNPAPIRILLAMASALDRMAWSIVLNNQQDIELVAATSSSRQLSRLLKLHAPRVVLFDEDLLRLCPGSLLAFARKTGCRFVLVAMHQPDYSIEPSQMSFIHARLLKGVTAPELLLTIRTTASELH
jgi:DNA-binding NarL/FixJ family response regulator